MKFLFNSVHYLYNYYMVYALVFPYLSYNPSYDHDYVTLSHTPSFFFKKKSMVYYIGRKGRPW